MFANLTFFLFGRPKTAKPVRRARLSLEALETRATPAACAIWQHTYDGLEGETYREVNCGTFVIQGNTDLSADDYKVTSFHGPFYHGPDPSLKQEGRKLTIQDELSSSDD